MHVEEKVPNDWMRAITIRYKGKSDKNECKNYRGISLLSMPDKEYGRVLIVRFCSLTEGVIGKEQFGRWYGRGCAD